MNDQQDIDSIMAAQKQRILFLETALANEKQLWEEEHLKALAYRDSLERANSRIRGYEFRWQKMREQIDELSHKGDTPDANTTA